MDCSPHEVNPIVTKFLFKLAPVGHEPDKGIQEKVSVQRVEGLKMDGTDGKAGEGTAVTFSQSYAYVSQ